MAVTHLQCKECATHYPLQALYVCERCFGPLEVAYDHSRLGGDVAELRRRIQGGPQNIWRYADFLPLAGSLLDGPGDDPKARARWLDEDGRAALAETREALAQAPSFDEASVEQALAGVIARRAAKPRDVYQPLRVALTGGTVSPGIFESVALLGREETLRRIDRALAGG